MTDEHQATIAYFSMEIAVDRKIPTYARGVGVLAGDALRSAADRGLPMVGVTLLPRRGYFRQQLDESGQQSEQPEERRLAGSGRHRNRTGRSNLFERHIAALLWWGVELWRTMNAAKASRTKLLTAPFPLEAR